VLQASFDESGFDLTNSVASLSQATAAASRRSVKTSAKI
jgi:hypothetical protein